jgi:hypothetical protein
MKKKIVSVFIVAFFMSCACMQAYAQIGVGVSITIAPPLIPVYAQPVCPDDGYIWTPGYWAYDEYDGYYWVPGVWVLPPTEGYLWTPAYWDYSGGFYGWHAGYWGQHIGFYGGVNYGYGYGGYGYGGGRWEGGAFRYNTSVTNVNTTIVHNTYVDRTVINNRTVNNRTSFNGPGGTTARPKPEELQAMHEQHVSATTAQQTHQQTASRDRSQFASVNHGKPATAAMDRVGGNHFNAQGHSATTTAATRPLNTHSSTIPHQPSQQHPLQSPRHIQSHQHQTSVRNVRPQQQMGQQEPRMQPQEQDVRETPQRINAPVQHNQPQPQRMMRPSENNHGGGGGGGGGGHHER